MSNKSKGSRVERELIKLFTEKGWKAARVAGSGVNDDSPCDLIAGKIGKKGVAVECKSSKKDRIYISKDQINDFMLFANMFGLKPVIALRFNYEGWLFIEPKYLGDTGNNWWVSLDLAKEKGKRFSQFFEGTGINMATGFEDVKVGEDS
jgi:holliday junction resolvase Hjr